MAQTTIKITTDGFGQNQLVYSLEKYGLSDICHFENHKNESIIVSYGAHEKTFKPPVRLGKIIDQIEVFKTKAQNQNTAFITLGDARLDTHLGVFQVNGREGITLTEKEIEILVYLHNNKGRIVPREELLDAVWNYAKDVETHTLETHIYRLRKKIESDPANPAILKTEENGYSVLNSY